LLAAFDRLVGIQGVFACFQGLFGLLDLGQTLFFVLQVFRNLITRQLLVSIVAKVHALIECMPQDITRLWQPKKALNQ